jgi:Domain of unknown function (DUF4291)
MATPPDPAEAGASREVRAVFDAQTIRVYQAYPDAIADTALAHGTFVSPPFKMTRMTWIKPSFLWMMYRAGWGFKDEGQRRILGIDIAREGFDWAVNQACPSHPDNTLTPAQWQQRMADAPAIVQWDPERDLLSRPLPQRSIQIGLRGVAVERYVNQWISRIEDVTPLAHHIHALVQAQRWAAAEAALPQERLYSITSPTSSPPCSPRP